MWNKSFAACLNMNLGEMECANERELNKDRLFKR